MRPTKRALHPFMQILIYSIQIACIPTKKVTITRIDHSLHSIFFTLHKLRLTIKRINYLLAPKARQCREIRFVTRRHSILFIHFMTKRVHNSLHFRPNLMWRQISVNNYKPHTIFFPRLRGRTYKERKN